MLFKTPVFIYNFFMVYKKGLLLIIVGFILISIMTVIIIFNLPGRNTAIPKMSPPIIVNHPIRPSLLMPFIRDGDIILRMSDSVWSHIFCNYSENDKRFSHLGIVRLKEDDVTVIHCEGSFTNKDLGVEELPLEYFLKVATSVGVYRVKNADGAIISNTAVKYLNYPFDFNFDLDDESTIYCTELLYHSLKPVKLEHILSTRYAEEVKKNIIPLDAISYSPYIDEIVYIIRRKMQ